MIQIYVHADKHKTSYLNQGIQALVCGAKPCSDRHDCAALAASSQCWMPSMSDGTLVATFAPILKQSCPQMLKDSHIIDDI